MRPSWNTAYIEGPLRLSRIVRRYRVHDLTHIPLHGFQLAVVKETKAAICPGGGHHRNQDRIEERAHRIGFQIVVHQFHFVVFAGAEEPLIAILGRCQCLIIAEHDT